MPIAPMLTFTYDPTVIAGFRQVAGERQAGGINNIAEDLSNLTWMWEMVVDGQTIEGIMEENELLVWEEGQTTWHPLSPRTVEAKRVRRLNPLVMVATGRLHTAATTAGHPDNVAFGDANSYSYGINIERFRSGGWSYPDVHQNIGVGRSRIKRRTVILQDATRNVLNAFFGRAIRLRMRGTASASSLKGLRTQ